MRQAIITIRQEFHDDLKKEARAGGKFRAKFQVPFVKGYCVGIGRNPRLDLADEVVYIPSHWCTRHIGYIRCLETVCGLIHILDIEAHEDKIKVYNQRNGKQIIRQHQFSDGDYLKLGGVPVFLEYLIVQGKDSGEMNNTIW